MKIKHVITTLALAGLMGAGAFAGIKTSGVAKEAKAGVYDSTIRVYVDLTWGSIDYVRIGGNTEGDTAILSSSNSKYDTTQGKYVLDITTDHNYDAMGLFFKQGVPWQYQSNDGYVSLQSGQFEMGKAYRISGIGYVSGDNPKYCTATASLIGNIPDDPAPDPHTSFSLCGSMNNWKTDNTDYDFTIAQDNSSATLTTRLEKDDEFKIIADRGWDFEINFKGLTLGTSVQNGLVAADPSAAKPNIKVARGGTFTFVLTIDTTTYEVSEASVSAVYAYKATINGVDHPLAPNAAGNTYSASGLNITAGQTISIKLDSATIDAAPELTASNNVYQDSTVYKVLADNASADLYYHVSANDYWVSGLASDGYHILKDGETFVQLTEGSTTESGHAQWYSDSIDFALNDNFRVIDCKVASSLPVLFDITTIEEYGEYANFTVSGGVVTCTKACTVQIYLKIKNGDNRIYFGSEPEDVALARQFAQSFIDDIVDGACQGGYPTQSGLETAWAAKATAYGQTPMTDDARDELKTNNSVQVIKDFRAAYVYILNLRGAGSASNWNLTDFFGLNNSESAALTPAANQSAKYAMPVVIVIVSSISLVSVLGIGLMIKRRKEDR